MTDRELKQRCLELGYDEEKIDRMIRDTNIWAILIRKSRGYFGRLFGDKYDDEVALREMIENWSSLTVIDAIGEDKIKHPEDYPTESEIESCDLDDFPICVNVGRGPWPGEIEAFQRKRNKRLKKQKEQQKRNHRMLRRKRKKRRKRN